MWDGDAYLKISNALGAVTDLTITRHGNVTWEYRSIHGTHVEPAALIAITISLLDPDAARPWPDLPLHRARAAILVAAGLTLPDIATSIACTLGRLQHIPSRP